MPKTVTVKLEKPLTIHGGNCTEVQIREPRGRDYIELGEPVAFARADKGLLVHAENDAAIRAYIERCMLKELTDVELIMDQATLVDAMNFKKAILSFFGDARVAQSASDSSSSSAT